MFIVFEGIDGSGKSSVISRLKDHLESKGRKVKVTAEPTDGPVGRFVSVTDDLSPEAEALLFTADRSMHTEQVKKWMDEGYDVLCDRYFASTLAYQSAAGMDIGWLRSINSKAIIEPDVTILMDIDPEVSLKRVSQRGEMSRFEKLDYLRKVRKAYLDIAGEFSFEIIDADRDRETVAEDVIAKVGVI